MSVARTVPARLRQLSAVQRHLWTGWAQGAPARAPVAALRLCGDLDEQRLVTAVAQTHETIEILRAGFAVEAGVPVMIASARSPAVIRHSVEDADEWCVRILREDGDRRPDPTIEPLVRFHILRRAPDEIVLGLVADPLVLDLRSVYLVLGAVMQAYVGRLRTGQYASLGAREVAPTGTPARQRWWLRRLRAWGSHVPSAAPGRQASTQLLRLDAQRWAGLTDVADNTGNSGWLAVIAMLTWWLRDRIDPARPVVFTSTLDLRDYLGLGPIVGPLTDRIVFEVELDGMHDMTFRDLVRRTHAGLLDAVVHYMPYSELVALGSATGLTPPPRPGVPWDLTVHYCRLPPASSYTRGEASLAREGLSIELFRESELGAGGMIAGPMEVQVAESGTGMAIVCNYDPAVIPHPQVTDLIVRMQTLVDRVAASPTLPLHQF
jgi:hypothetical protein